MWFDDFTISRIEFRLTAEAIGSEEEEEESVDLFPVFNFTG